MGKIEVIVKEVYGTCEKSLFQKMLKKGDVTSNKVPESVGTMFKLKGYCSCSIKTTEKEFDIVYYDTNKGIFSTGSEGFFESIKEYLEDTKDFMIVSYKSKKGTGYKAMPVIEEDDDIDEI